MEGHLTYLLVVQLLELFEKLSARLKMSDRTVVHFFV